MKVQWMRAIGSLSLLGFACVTNAQRFDGVGYIGSPAAEARPGVIYFQKAAEAVRHKDYKFAVEMYVASASWAYKTAQYNLAIMYLHGEGVPVDRPRAMAWMALAAERNDKDYVEARELIYADLTAEEFEQANVIYRELKPEFGDATALKRASEKWVATRNETTGSRLGFVGDLHVGTAGGERNFGFEVPNPATERREAAARRDSKLSKSGPPDGFATSSFGFTGGHEMPGSDAYQELRETNNPYDPRFTAGTATVGPIIPLGEKKESDAPANDAEKNGN
jgi:hypothetical protein